MTERKADLLLFTAAVLWGSSYVFSDILLVDGLSTLQIMAVRFCMAAAGISAVFNKRLFGNFSKDAVKCGATIGIMHFFGIMLELKGLELSPASKAGFLVSVNVIFVPVLMWLVGKNKPKARLALCAVSTFFGVALMSLKSNMTIGVGELMLLAAGFLYAASTVALVILSKNASSIQITFVQFVAIAALSVVSLLFVHMPPVHISASAWGALIFLAAVCSVFCYILKNWAIKFTSATKGTIILSTEGIFTAILSGIILHQMLTPRMIAGAAIIFASVLYAELCCG